MQQPQSQNNRLPAFTVHKKWWKETSESAFIQLICITFLILLPWDDSSERLENQICKYLHVNTILTCVITAQPHLTAEGLSTTKPWSSLKTQWNEQYRRARPGIAERAPGTPRSSCWLERSIHICAFLGFPSGVAGPCCVANLQPRCFAFTQTVTSTTHDEDVCCS